MENALEMGTVPLIWFSPDPADTLRSYVALYLREEVQMEGLVRDVGAFSRFLEAASFSHASVLNVANVARECQVERKTVAAYFEILRDLLLAFDLPVFSHRAKRELSTHERFYFFDAGVFRSLRPTGPLDRPEEISGAALEGLVVQHLKAWADYRDDGHKVYFWRTRSGLEVDAVVYGPAGLWGIEVKNSATIQPAHLRGLTAFRDEYPDARLILLYQGTEPRLTNGIHCVPCQDFLKTLRPSALIGEE
jgi:predicted AAA+ superfamily ATPase